MPKMHLVGTNAEETFKYGIHHVATASDLEATISLFVEYTTWLGLDLSFQGFAEEVASMPGKYAPEAGGCLLLARNTTDSAPLGCVAMRAMAYSKEVELGRTCEMKRLYVAPAGRKYGVGRALAHAIIHEARTRGYQEMKLDTLPFMTAALALYEQMGFKRVAAYYNTPIEGTVFLSKDLGAL